MTTQPVIQTECDSFDVPAFQRCQAILQAEMFLRGRANPITYYPVIARTLSEVKGVEARDAMNLLEVAEWRVVQLVNKLLKASALMLKAHKAKAVKPMAIYQKYASTLDMIVERGGEDVADAAREAKMSAYLEQTRSEGELASPDWIDSYTGEILPREEIDIKVPELSNLPIQEAGNYAMADLGWDLKTLNQFIKAQDGGFSELDTDEVIEDDDRGFVPPTLEKDFAIDVNVQSQSWDAVKNFNTARSAIFKEMKAESELRDRIIAECRENINLPATPANKAVISGAWIDLKSNLARAKSQDWQAEFRAQFECTPEFAAMIVCIEKLAREDTVTAAVVYLKVEGEYGLDQKDIAQVRVYEEAYSLLVDFLDMNEGDVAELIHDAAFSPMSESDYVPTIERFTNDIFGYNNEDTHVQGQLEKVMPAYHINPTQTSSWNIAYVQAMTGGADMDKATIVAWNAWREAMSPEGAKAYNQIIAESSNRQKAMAAFWKFCGPEVPRPQDKIQSILGNKSGLKLESGREISWAVACMKLKGHELDLNGDIKERLAKKLIEMNIGAQFVALLK